MELHVADEQAAVLREIIGPQEALQRADSAKVSAFGNLNKLLFRPKEEDIQLGTIERRLDPFWHVKAHAEYEFERRARFVAPVSDAAEVQRVTLDGHDEPLTVENGEIVLHGVEHCVTLLSKEQFLDAVTGESCDYKNYTTYPADPITDLAAFQPEGILVVPPQKRASLIVRQLLAEMMKPLDADAVHKEIVEVETIVLYWRPIYAFAFEWPSKQKQAILEVDGLTGQVRDGQQRGGQIGRFLTPEVLFDIGADAVDLLVPGGGIALKVGRALAQRSEARKK